MKIQTTDPNTTLKSPVTNLAEKEELLKKHFDEHFVKSGDIFKTRNNQSLYSVLKDRKSVV